MPKHELPERERTKHVHRLHPYLGKFIPRVVEVLLDRYVPPRWTHFLPFRGLVAPCQGRDRLTTAMGGDIATSNCLLMHVKTARYKAFTLERLLLYPIFGTACPLRGQSLV